MVRAPAHEHAHPTPSRHRAAHRERVAATPTHDLRAVAADVTPRGS